MRDDLPLRGGEALPRFEAGDCPDRVPGRARPDPPGRGRLEVASVDGASAVLRCSATAPLHLFTPRPRGGGVSTVVATYGGGLVAGDDLELAVDVGPGAVATIGTQAETKVYRSDGRWAAQRMTATVGDAAALAVVPEPTSCFAGARYRQHQRFELHPRATLLLLDAITPGRSARGERWAFEAYLSRNDVLVGGRSVLCDGLRLLAGEAPPVHRRMRGFEFLATVVAVGPALAGLSRAVLDRVAAGPAEERGGVLLAASPLLDGVHLRVAARSVAAGLAHVRGEIAQAFTVFGRHALERRP